MRRTKSYPVERTNALWQIYKTVSFWKVVKNVVVIQLARYSPFMGLKNSLYRKLLRMSVGHHTAFAFMTVPDIMFPEKITVGKNSVIGYNTTILAHEYLIHEYRIGDVMIGDDVMIGANTTILPGVTIGNRAIVSAHTLVHKDVPPDTFVGGNPMQFIQPKGSTGKREEKETRKNPSE